VRQRSAWSSWPRAVQLGRLEPGVKVMCDREPGFGLFVAVEDGGGAGGVVARYRDGQHLVVDGRVE
jgi:hypothetical protein